MSEYTNCDICDVRPGTHEIAYGGVRCDECREKAEQKPARKDLQHPDAGPRGERYPFGDPQ